MDFSTASRNLTLAVNYGLKRSQLDAALQLAMTISGRLKYRNSARPFFRTNAREKV